MLAGISTEAAQMVDGTYMVRATDNWFFMMVSTALIVLIGTLVTDKLVEPRLGTFQQAEQESEVSAALTKLSPSAENRHPGAAGAGGGPGRRRRSPEFPAAPPETGSLTTGAPLINGLIPLIALLFFIPSVVYGRISGVYKGEKDVCSQLEKNMSMMGSYIALVFIAAQFISFFNYSRLGTILAINGAEFLKSTGVSGPLLMFLFILLTALINLVMGSASAKWTILAPVFIPMFMMLGYSPALTQVAYRIGDSCTNLISPMMSYFAMVVVFAKKYDSTRESAP